MTIVESHARFLLLALLAEIEQFAELPDDAFDADDPFVAAMYHQGVPFAPAFWTGERLPSSRRMAFSRAARRLAARGQVRRVTERNRDRVRYLVPTTAGLVRALALAHGRADRQAVREGLNRTRWGHALAGEIGGEQ